MARDATVRNDNAETDYTSWEKTAMGKYQDAASGYMSNVNAAIAAGNPYQSKDYLQSQNIQTSGAMNAANSKAGQQLRDTALRTGSNTGAVGAQIAENARAGQRQMTQYNAERDTQNADKWLQQSNALRGQQLAGANSQLAAFGDAAGGRSNALGNLTTLNGQENQLWETGIGAIGAAAGGAFANPKI